MHAKVGIFEQIRSQSLAKRGVKLLVQLKKSSLNCNRFGNSRKLLKLVLQIASTDKR